VKCVDDTKASGRSKSLASHLAILRAKIVQLRFAVKDTIAFEGIETGYGS
jgi:hypothetical protein